MDFHQIIDILKTNLEFELPGWKAQQIMSVAHRVPYQKAPVHAVKAAVLILIHEQNNIPHITFVKRQSISQYDKHKGQISFPGGKYEPDDINLWNTALRETEEEIGIESTKITKLGKLTPLYIPVSNFLVHPYVGYTHHSFNYLLQTSEIEKAMDVPIGFLLDHENKGTTNVIAAEKYHLTNVPYFDINGEVMWGATAMMTSEFIALFPSKIKSITSSRH